jgi:hypothetical protein
MNKNTAQRISRLIKEVLSKPLKEDKCNCGCHSCENVGNKGPVLNENLGAKITMTENMQYHVTNKLPLTENTFRYGSEAFLNLWAEARYLHEHNAIHLNDDDKELVVETDLGEYGIFEGKKVPLDLLMSDDDYDSTLGSEEEARDTNSILFLPYLDRLKDLKMRYNRSQDEKSKNFFMNLHDDLLDAITRMDRDDINNIVAKYPNYFVGLNEADKKKKNPPLGKPKRGGSKKFYVYVRDPKSKRIKKVSFGMAGGGLRAKLNNPKARQAFAKRHNCAQKKDKTKASYWSCRLPRYAKALGFNTTFSGYW